jgi:hypothetical protein
MSHFATVRTLITDEQLLIATLSQLSIRMSRNEILVSACGITTLNTMDITLSKPDWERPRCGFSWNGDHFGFVSYIGYEEDKEDIFQKILTTYATNKALKESAALSQRGAHVSVVVN